MRPAGRHATRIVAGLGLLLLLVAAAPPASHAQSSKPIESFWMTNGTVHEVVPSGGRVYLGGTFTMVGPPTGGAAALDIGTGAADLAFPRVEGLVQAVAPDGAGGWFLGGIFTKVGGVARNNLAHVLGNRRVSAWNPNPTGSVSALAAAGRTVYVGGSFSNVGGQPRNNLAALDAATGLATGWNPSPNSQVLALAASNGVVYAGGVFTLVGSQARNFIAAIDAGTGMATGWAPNADGIVRALAVSGATVYAGGSFTNIGSQPRNRIAALDGTGAATGWNPSANATVEALAVAGATVYAGGSFTNIGSQPRNRIAALDGTGAATGWDPDANGSVLALAASGGTAYAAGVFTTVGGLVRNNLAAIDGGTGLPTSWAPQANGLAEALALQGNTVCVGGQFSSAGGSIRNRLAALDPLTGALLPWDPDASGSVFALDVFSGTIYAGGLFSTVGGIGRVRIAAIDVAGVPTPWDPGADLDVNTLVAAPATVYAGGNFTSIGGQPQQRIAGLDSTTGMPATWSPANGTVYTVALSGGTLYAGGIFNNIGGQARNWIGAVDAGTGLATGWNPNADQAVRTLLLSGAVVYAGGAFTMIGGASRNNVAALAVSTGNATPWNPNPNGQVSALAISGSTLFAGGSFTMMGAVPRNRVAAVDAASGAVLGWDPNANGSVEALAQSGNRVHVGGTFSNIGGQTRGSLAAFCLTPAPSGLVAMPGGPNQINLTWVGTAPGYNVYRSRSAGGPYQLLGSSATTSYSDTTAEGTITYYYVVRAVDQCESDPSNVDSASASGACNLPPDFDGVAWAEPAPGSPCSVQVGWAPAMPTCGPGLFYSVYRDTSPAFTPSLANRIAEVTAATSYTDSTTLLPDTAYYYVVRATSTTNGREDQNDIRQSATPTACTPGGTDAVQLLTVTSKDSANTLQWQYPPGAGMVTVKILRTVSSTPCPVPPPTDLGYAVQNGNAGERGTFVDAAPLPSPPVNNVNYCYTLYVDKGIGNFSASRTNSGRPFDTSGLVKWAFSMGMTAMVPPGIGVGAIHVVANNNALHSAVKGLTGGTWPGGTWPELWKPLKMAGPSQGRPSTVPLSVLGSQRTIFLGAQDGKVRAIDADTGAELWSTPLGVAGTQVQAGPAGIFKFIGAFGVPYDYILVGTRDSSGDNAFYALNMADGSVATGWPFAGGGPEGRIGIISSQAAVDYATRRVFFTSRRRNDLVTDNTVWCVNLDDGTIVWAKAYGNIDASPTLRKGATLADDRLYIGTSEGPGSKVKALKAENGDEVWSLTPGDGPIKSFVMLDRLSPANDLYFSTTGNVWAYMDDGVPTQKWAGPRMLLSPSAPVAIAGGAHVYVGAGNGKLYRLKASDGADDTPAFPPLQLGDGLAGVGSPTIDTREGFAYAGNEAGIVYGVQIP